MDLSTSLGEFATSILYLFQKIFASSCFCKIQKVETEIWELCESSDTLVDIYKLFMVGITWFQQNVPIIYIKIFFFLNIILAFYSFSEPI